MQLKSCQHRTVFSCDFTYAGQEVTDVISRSFNPAFSPKRVVVPGNQNNNIYYSRVKGSG